MEEAMLQDIFDHTFLIISLVISLLAFMAAVANDLRKKE
jgi:hypothetical protein